MVLVAVSAAAGGGKLLELRTLYLYFDSQYWLRQLLLPKILLAKKELATKVNTIKLEDSNKRKRTREAPRSVREASKCIKVS